MKSNEFLATWLWVSWKNEYYILIIMAGLMAFTKHFHGYAMLSFMSSNIIFLQDRMGLSQEKM